METNEQKVEGMYPSVPVLNAAQTAAVLGWDRKRIYNMAESLPFVNRVGGDIVVSKRVLVEWLDEIDRPKAKPEPPPPSAAPAVSSSSLAAPLKKKVGRRRNSEKRANDPLSVLFVQQVAAEAQRKAFEDAIEACKAIKLPEDDKAGKAILESLIALPGELLAERETFEFALMLKAIKDEDTESL